MSRAEAIEYLCPDERHPISRPLHLARLAAFHPACRGCPHRFDHAGLSPRVIRQRESLEAAPANQRADACQETLGGRHARDIFPADARNLGAALGVQAAAAGSGGQQPRVALAFDGRPLLAEYVASAAEGIRWTGCELIDLGVATAPALALGQALAGADAALYLGSQGGEAHDVSLKFWGQGGVPYSLGAGLEVVGTTAASLPGRPSRRSGSVVRCDVTEQYLRRLRGYFHALRPLRLVLDTASWPFRRELQTLLQTVACQVLPVMALAPDANALTEPARDRRSARIAHSVREQQAHFALWVDGDGERLRLWDEQGCEVPCHRILGLLARHLLPARDGAAVVVEDTLAGPERLLFDLWCQSWQTRRMSTQPTRQAMHAALLSPLAPEDEPAAFGGGPSGRVWLPTSGNLMRQLVASMHFASDEPPGQEAATEAALFLPDALEVLTHLLVVLSGSDQPLSQVLP